MYKFSRWNKNLFRLDKSYSSLVELWDGIASSLDENKKMSYYNSMNSWAKQRMSSDKLKEMASQLLPADKVHLHDELVAHISAFCQLDKSEEQGHIYKNQAEPSSRYLPHVSDINARLILACLYAGLEFPCTDEPALHICSSVKALIGCRVEGGIKASRNFVISESGMLRFKPMPPGEISRVTLRDVADSLTLSSPCETAELLEYVDHFDSMATFCKSLMVQNN